MIVDNSDRIRSVVVVSLVLNPGGCRIIFFTLVVLAHFIKAFFWAMNQTICTATEELEGTRLTF